MAARVTPAKGAPGLAGFTAVRTGSCRAPPGAFLFPALVTTRAQQTGRHSPLSYLVKPFADYSRAFRES